ncbi:mariner Mos1 transposase [Trichonephila clavipes]|nr:mariner Mos1 transposase [Trichonephila clavipes]
MPTPAVDNGVIFGVGYFDVFSWTTHSECLSHARVFQWFKRFKDGRQDVEDDSRPGRPSTSKTEENVEKVASLIRSDRRLSIRAIAETVNIDKECVRQILHDNLNMQKVFAKMVPKILTFEQQATRKNVCTDILDAIKNDPNLLEKVITCDESWFFTYDPETKRQSMHWKTPTSPRAKKARMSKSKFKAMMIVFFDIHEIVYLHWDPEGQTIYQHYDLEVLGNLRERIRKKRPEMWKEKSWIFHQDNAPAHSALSVKRFLAKHSIPVLEHPPYSPDLAPCDIYLFRKNMLFGAKEANTAVLFRVSKWTVSPHTRGGAIASHKNSGFRREGSVVFSRTSVVGTMSDERNSQHFRGLRVDMNGVVLWEADFAAARRKTLQSQYDDWRSSMAEMLQPIPFHQNSPATLFIDWTSQQWSRVLFEDDNRFSLNNDYQRQLKWRDLGTRFHFTNIRERDL